MNLGGGGIALILNLLYVRDHRLAYLFWYRMFQTIKNRFFYYFAGFMLFRFKRLYGLHISPYANIGSGLYLGHGIGIVIHPSAKIGCNCRLSQFITIGSNKGTAANIGDNVYIGPNVCIVENVRIGSNVKIGAGTIVINDVPEDTTTVGNPNRIVIKT